jgi:hypothetical protein
MTDMMNATVGAGRHAAMVPAEDGVRSGRPSVPASVISAVRRPKSARPSSAARGCYGSGILRVLKPP